MVHVSTSALNFCFLTSSGSRSLSYGDGAADDFVLQHDADDEEDEVEHEHE